MLAYYGDRISPHMTDTPEGYLICHDVPIARTGEQDYLARELNLDGDPDRTVPVYRHPKDVFDAAVLASFEGKDVTQQHPPENVGPENHAMYSKGHVENVRRDGEYIIADLHIKDAGLISDIKNGVMREVSCGYLCNYLPEGNGFRQTHIRGNHVAVVPRGRAGREVAIKDAAVQAEKGRRSMSEFWKSVLTAFGMAARDASPEELDAMVNTAANALDPAPAKKAQEEDPAKKGADAEEKKDAGEATDEMVERAPKGDDLGTKLDRVIEMLSALTREKKDEHMSDEGDLDKLIGELSGKKEAAPEEGKALTIPVENCGDDGEVAPEAKDAAAAELLKKVRPAVAAIRDRRERARVVDALVGSVRGNEKMADIVRAAHGSAQRAADAARRSSYETICAEAQSAYNARNPHKAKKEEL